MHASPPILEHSLAAANNQRRSTILTSQMPIAHWHEQVGDPSIADSIMDRLVHNSYRIELSGESIRKERARSQGTPLASGPQ